MALVYSKSTRGVCCVDAAMQAFRPAQLESRTLQPGYRAAGDGPLGPQLPGPAACLLYNLLCYVCTSTRTSSCLHSWWLTMAMDTGLPSCHSNHATIHCRCGRHCVPTCCLCSGHCTNTEQVRCTPTNDATHAWRPAQPCPSWAAFTWSGAIALGGTAGPFACRGPCGV